MIPRAPSLLGCVVLAIAGCADLPDVEPGVCGNGVLDKNTDEDCDGAAPEGSVCSPPGTVHACHYVCTGGTCPSGMACGADQQCRAPSGTLVATSDVEPFLAIDTSAGDADGDGITDLLGVSDSALTVRFGDATSPLHDVTTQVIDPPSGAAVFAQLDDVPGIDVIIPTALGVFSLLADGRAYEPFAYSSYGAGESENITVVGAQYAGGQASSDLLALIGPVAIYIGVPTSDGPAIPICVDNTRPLAGANPCPNAPDISRLLGAPAIGRTGFQAGSAVAGGDPTDELVLAYKGAGDVSLWSARKDVSVVDGSGNLVAKGPGLVHVQTIALPSGMSVAHDGMVAFGHLDLDACLDLVISVEAGNRDGFVIAYGARDSTTKACSGMFSVPITDGLQGTTPSGMDTSGLILRAVADLDGDGLDDVVTNNWIMRSTCARDQPACGGHWASDFTTSMNGPTRTPRTWSRVVVTDFNGDQRADLAGAASGQATVDAMLGVAPGLYTRFQIATDAPVRELQTADFDGDLIGDVAIVSGDAVDPNESDDLSVAFGQTSGGPSAPIVMGHIGKFVSMSLLFLPNLSFDILADALLIARVHGQYRLTGFYGSTSRRLLAPFQLSDSTGFAPTAVQVGAYDAKAGADILALARSSGSGSDEGSDFEDAYFLSGGGDGDVVAAPPKPLPHAAFGYEQALWASGAAHAGASNDTIVGVDGALVSHPSASGGAEIDTPASPHVFIAGPDPGYASPTLATLTAPAGAQPIALQVADLDGDGALDALVELVVPGTTVSSTALIIPALDPTRVQPLFTASTCQAVTPIQLDGDPELELAAICHDNGTTLRLLDVVGGAWTTLADLPLQVEDSRLVAGDFDGDGVVDLAVLAGTRTQARTVRVFHQCPVGDKACAGKGP